MAEDETDVTGVQRITVNLSKRADWALNLICSTTGESKTSAVNDALRLYAMVLGAGPDAELYIARRPSYNHERLLLP